MKICLQLLLAVLFLPNFLLATNLELGQSAPLFELKNQSGETVKLSDRKGRGWTVLFFYPKAGTPGCTKQACAFRDSIKVIRDKHAEVYGISSDTVPAQAKFHQEHKLTFPLLADPNMKTIEAYGVKMLGFDMAKRWTFILDPGLTIRAIDDKVDPVMDPQKVATQLSKLQKE